MIEVNVDSWPRVELDGVVWAVAPRYIHAVAIGDGPVIAAHHGCELPTPRLVDAIWAAADCRLPPITRINRGNVDGLVLAQAQAVAAQIAAWEAERGAPAMLVAGTHKDVVATRWGRPGLYGWHRLDGRAIQPESAVHAPGYRDYSQGLRLVRRINVTR